MKSSPMVKFYGDVANAARRAAVEACRINDVDMVYDLMSENRRAMRRQDRHAPLDRPILSKTQFDAE